MFSKLTCTEPTYLNHVISLVKHTEPAPRLTALKGGKLHATTTLLQFPLVELNHTPN